MRLLILGATGKVGRHAVEQALARGHETTVLVRRPVPELEHPALRLLIGNPLDGVDLRTALVDERGRVDAVLCSIGMQRENPANPWSRAVSPPDLTQRLAEALVPAMEASGVRRLVAVSAAGVGDSAPRLNMLMKFFLATTMIGAAYRDLEAMEHRLTASNLDWVAPRPTRLVDGRPSGRVNVVPAFGLADAISRADVATWMLDAVEQPSWPRPDWGGRTPQISGLR
jgi:uncharacterized protein YbjT (DUF2867 family)